MKRDISTFVRKCDTCQRCKRENTLTPGLLQPLLIPDQDWSCISMDFVEGLPKSQSKDTILVVIDRYTKYGHFIALTHPFSAKTVADLYMENIYKLHGLSQDIVSDRDKIFISKFWQRVFKQLGIKLSMSTTYHP